MQVNRYVSTWFAFDVCSTLPFQSLSLLFTDHSGGLGYKLLSMLRLWRLRRVSSLFAKSVVPRKFAFFLTTCLITALSHQLSPSFIRLEKDIRFNYFWTRCTKLVSVSRALPPVRGSYFWCVCLGNNFHALLCFLTKFRSLCSRCIVPDASTI